MCAAELIPRCLGVISTKELLCSSHEKGACTDGDEEGTVVQRVCAAFSVGIYTVLCHVETAPEMPADVLWYTVRACRAEGKIHGSVTHSRVVVTEDFDTETEPATVAPCCDIIYDLSIDHHQKQLPTRSAQTRTSCTPVTAAVLHPAHSAAQGLAQHVCVVRDRELAAWGILTKPKRPEQVFGLSK